MQKAKSGQDKLLVWTHGRSAVVRVLGRGSFMLGTALREFGTASAEAGARRLILDLERCVGMDSTFMGVVAGLALRMNASASGRVVFANLTERTRHMLCTLGLDRFVDLHMGGETPAEIAGALAGTGRDAPRETVAGEWESGLSRTMIDAHEALVTIEPENFSRFRDVLEFLRRDVERVSGRDPEP